MNAGSGSQDFLIGGILQNPNIENEFQNYKIEADPLLAQIMKNLTHKVQAQVSQFAQNSCKYFPTRFRTVL